MSDTGVCSHTMPFKRTLTFYACFKQQLIFYGFCVGRYLYDGASLGFDAAASQDNLNDFRTRLTKSLATPANAIPSVRNDSAPTGAPTAGVNTQSFTTVPPALASGQVLQLTYSSFSDQM